MDGKARIAAAVAGSIAVGALSVALKIESGQPVLRPTPEFATCVDAL
jgi:hypothetical protein